MGAVQQLEAAIVAQFPGSLAGDPADYRGNPTLTSIYPVSALASASIAIAGRAGAALVAALGHPTPGVTVDRTLADAWFGMPVAPVGWELPSPWDPIAGDYLAADGWIRLHTNAILHRAAALRVLGVEAERNAVAHVVSGWNADELEAAVVAEGGAAATMRSAAAWAEHPQGVAVAAEPLFARDAGSAGPLGSRWRPTAARPLAGLRVLDLTRVLAGPTATRLLAGLGAEVLRIDPPDWSEPGVTQQMTLGKRAAHLDARNPEALETLRRLLSESDVLVHGYRSDALERLGLSVADREALRPGLVDVSLDAYGFTGPWQHRRGFDSLVQMSSGIAEAGMRAARADHPVPLPVQALDCATGYLMAAAALVGLTGILADGTGSRWRLSLARTGVELERARASADPESIAGAPELPTTELPTTELDTAWGPARLTAPPLLIEGAALSWTLGPRPLGTDAPTW